MTNIKVGEQVIAQCGKKRFIGTLRQLPRDDYEPYLVEPFNQPGYYRTAYAIKRKPEKVT